MKTGFGTLSNAFLPSKLGLFFAGICLLLGTERGDAGPSTDWWRELDLHTVNGSSVAAPARWLAVVFLDPECPVANGYVPVLNALALEFGSRGVLFLGAYTDPAAPLEKLQLHAREFGLKFAAVDDRRQRLAHLAGASYSAETAVFDAKGKLLYRGRIDDRVGAGGAARPAATRHDLQDVLSRLLAGETGPFAGERGFGCALAAPGRQP